VVPAPARTRRCVNHPDRDAALVRFCQRRGRDRVITWLDRRQKLQVEVERQLARSELFQKIYQRDVLLEDLLPISGHAIRIVTAEREQPLFLRRTLSVLGEHLDLGTSGDVL
jgi:hypothetical protein